MLMYGRNQPNIIKQLSSNLKKKEVLIHEKTPRNLKCTLINQQSQSEKSTQCMFLTICHSGKGKTMETVKSSMVTRGWEER